MQGWIAAETQGADFGDERLNRRYELILDRLSDQPTRSIPAACGGWAETLAAYRFFDNPKTDAAEVLRPHRRATLERVRAHPLVLLAQDTTELELLRRHERVGGPLNDVSRWGLYVHPLLALTPQRVPLGVVAAEIWSRDPEAFARSPQQKRRDRKAASIEQKESLRWLKGYREACALADEALGTRIVAISDSEGDIYECLLAAQGGAAEYLLRGCHDRATSEQDGPSLRQTLACRTSLGTVEVRLSKREASTGDRSRKRKQARPARRARLTVRTAEVLLRGPRRPGGKLPDLFVHAILAKEEKPPSGEEAVEWLLLTSLPIGTFAEVTTALDYYCCRWEIEVYFRTLKGGCRVERLQLERQDRLEVCLALYLIVAWRVLYVLMQGRECPSLRCDAVFAEAEWKSVYVIARGQAAPAEPPPLSELVALIAELGGYLGRKCDGPPGPQAMWIGLQRMRDFALAWARFGPAQVRNDV